MLSKAKTHTDTQIVRPQFLFFISILSQYSSIKPISLQRRLGKNELLPDGTRQFHLARWLNIKNKQTNKKPHKHLGFLLPWISQYFSHFKIAFQRTAEMRTDRTFTSQRHIEIHVSP